MALVNTILAPQESVNDQFLSLISLLVKTGEFVKSNTLIAELETSKAVVEVRAENDGYIKVFVEENTDIKIGSKMFEFYDTPIEKDIKTDIALTEKNLPITEQVEKVKTIFSKAALKYIEDNKLNVVYNAPYHSEFNPIENVFSLFRNKLNRNETKNIDQIMKITENFILENNEIKLKNIFDNSVKTIDNFIKDNKK
jgi:transposase